MDKNLKCDSGSALHDACLCGKTEVAKVLLEDGIDLSIPNIQGQVSQTLKFSNFVSFVCYY